MIAAWHDAAATEVRGDWKWWSVSSETASKTDTLYQLSGNFLMESTNESITTTE
jgi:hypothetical protein